MATTSIKVIEIVPGASAAVVDTIIEAAITALSLTAVQAKLGNSVRLSDGRVLFMFLY